MIVQTAPKDEPRWVIDQLAHTHLAGQLGRRFGNDGFAPLSPKPLMEYLVEHHDEGWALVDREMPQDPETGLPYNLVRTPVPLLLRTGPTSPEFNERHHPYCGLLVSMHTYGLYNGRYGLSDKVFVDLVAREYREAIVAMLDAELERQARLKRVLAGWPECREWCETEHLFHNYKLLQFFDTLALYFNMTHEEARGTATFASVPRALGRDVEVTVRRLAPGRYGLSPYPFARDPLELTCEGRRLAPLPLGTDVAGHLRALPVETETITVVEA